MVRRHRARTAPRFPSRRLISAKSLPDHGHSNLALAGALVEIAEHDLLPGAEREFAAGQGEAFGRTDQGAAQVRVSVVIAPARVMRVVGIGGCDLFQRAAHVAYASGFELDG